MEHPRQIELVAQGQRLGIDLRPPDDEDLLFRAEKRQRLVERMHHVAPFDRNILPRDDHVAPPRQRTSQRLIGFAAHHHRMSRSDGLEMLQIFGNMPQKAILTADHSVLGHCDDNGNHV